MPGNVRLCQTNLINHFMNGTLLAAQTGKDAQACRIGQQAEVMRYLIEELACLVHVVFDLSQAQYITECLYSQQLILLQRSMYLAQNCYTLGNTQITAHHRKPRIPRQIDNIPEEGEVSMKRLKSTALAALLLAAAAAHAADPNLGRNLAATCANCHGTDGKAVPGSGLDALAGESKEKLLQKLADFKSGDKPASIMHQISRGYTDEQLRLIAEYFAAQK